MTSLAPRVCLQIRDARRAAKLSQSVVAAEVGCKQSALSMFEQGDGTKLNSETIRKLAEKFHVELSGNEEDESASQPSIRRLPATLAVASGFCPNPQCPTNHAYAVDGRSYLLPDRAKADPAGGRFCALCGEVLERRCPNCGAPVHEGAICSFCGDPYVAI